MSPIEIADPVTGEVTYTFVREEGVLFGARVITATDYDTADEYPWHSYTVNYGLVPLEGSYLRSAVSVLDDGRTFTLEKGYLFFSGNIPVADRLDRTTLLDVQGRLDYSHEVYQPILGRFLEAPPHRSRAEDWNTVTGKLDFAVTTHFDGRVVSQDFDATTGLLDFAVTSHADGRVVSKDYDAATGLLDFRSATAADGVLTATDYDLKEEHPWTAYTVVYAADGGVIGTFAF